MYTRPDCERSLGRALSRHIGYTTGAYKLDRIAATTNLLKGRPYRYELELLKYLTDSSEGAGVKERYAEGILNFAVGLGLVDRPPVGGGLPRLILTPAGRAYAAARALEKPDLADLILTHCLLDRDADYYLLILDLVEQGVAEETSRADAFAAAIYSQRVWRAGWLSDTFPNAVLLKRIVEHVGWLSVTAGDKLKFDDVGRNYGRHHSAPRIGWAKQLGHIDDRNALTEQGAELRTRLLAGRESFFWLGPPEQCARVMRLGVSELGPREPAWNVLRPTARQQADEALDDLADELADWMGEAFDTVRLATSNQAPIDSVLPYLYLRERELGRLVDEQDILRRVFSRHRGRFAPMSKRTGLFGHYQVRKRR